MNAFTFRLRFRIRAINSDVAQRVRQTLTDDFGNQLTVSVADSPWPCRSCLRVGGTGERRIVFAYRPFATSGPYAEVGPIFIHAEGCTPYAEVNQFPRDFVERCGVAN